MVPSVLAAFVPAANLVCLFPAELFWLGQNCSNSIAAYTPKSLGQSYRSHRTSGANLLRLSQLREIHKLAIDPKIRLVDRTNSGQFRMNSLQSSATVVSSDSECHVVAAGRNCLAGAMAGTWRACLGVAATGY